MIRYMINGWEYGHEYFHDLGRFTKRQMEKLEQGKIVWKNGNAFWIENNARV